MSDPLAAFREDMRRLRAECVRARATSVSVQKGVARIDGLELPESRKVRLQRLVPRAVAKDGGEFVLSKRYFWQFFLSRRRSEQSTRNA